MGYIIAAVLAVACVVLFVRYCTLRRQSVRQENKLINQQLELSRTEQQLQQTRQQLAELTEAIDQPLISYVDGKPRKNTAASNLEGAVEGSFTCDGRQYEGCRISNGQMLLVRDVTEQGQAERMRQELTANVSHELKTPLHAISGYAEMMAQGIVKPEDVPGFAENIYKEAGRMSRLVEDILSLSRMDDGRGYEWEDMDLYEKAVQVVSQLQPLADRAGVSLILSGRPCQIRAIDQLLGMLLHNLIDNAIKYNRPDGRVEVQVVDGVLTVVDTGIGIPKEAQSRIFERFYRVDKSRSKAVGGTGLGLSIVKHAARIMNAPITLQSDEGLGTSISVTFDAQA